MKTRIMYRASMSYAGMEKYLSQLLELGLLESSGSVARYSTTAKGSEFLNRWAELSEFIHFDKTPAFLELRLPSRR